MIRIHKSRTVPEILKTKGSEATRLLERAFEANPAQFTSHPGTPTKAIAKMQFEPTIYGDKTVKDSLISDQHGKCCYCEAKIKDNGFGDVEHFRPKKAYQKVGEKRLTYPGYYWLAYDWQNLLFVCEVCNRKFKRSRFPLHEESTRVENHLSAKAVSDEKSLLINPLTDNPDDHIVFVQEIPFPKNASPKGDHSIKYYGLKRMNETRKEYIQALKSLLSFKDIDETDENQLDAASKLLSGMNRKDLIESIQNARLLYKTAAKGHMPFSLCVRNNFRHLPTD